MIVVQFNMAQHTVSEGAAVGVEICIDITVGIVGAAGLTVNVFDVPNLSAAIGESECGLAWSLCTGIL